LPQPRRRLAAIMFTDMVGYTAIGQKDEQLALALVEDQKRLIRPVLSRRGGREVKTIGDAFLVEFQSALDAVKSA
jgi:adenylate cyclase